MFRRPTHFTDDDDADQIEGLRGQVAPQPWMTPPATRAVLATVTAALNIEEPAVSP